MAKKTLVEVTIKFPGIHSWADATPPVAFLKHPHRHTFIIIARKEVSGLDREIEFIQFRQEIVTYLGLDRLKEESLYLGNDSCEIIADRLVDKFDLHSCTVSEDGEFAATVISHGNNGTPIE